MVAHLINVYRGHQFSYWRKQGSWPGDAAVSVLLFGVSHRSAPVSVLEQLSIDESDQIKIVDRVLQSPLVTEAMVLSTCNRVEVYAVVDAFHGGLAVIGQVLMALDYAYLEKDRAAKLNLFPNDWAKITEAVLRSP